MKEVSQMVDSEISNTNKNKAGNVKKLFKWEGKKELLWIGFVLLILFCAWAYKRDTELCKAVALEPCYYCAMQTQAETSLPQPAGFEGIKLGDGGNSKQAEIG